MSTIRSNREWCYDPIKDQCDGRCQGATDCKMAQYYKGIITDRPTRKEMIDYMRESEVESKHWEEFKKSDVCKQLLDNVCLLMEFRRIFISHPLECNFGLNRKLIDVLVNRYLDEFNNMGFKPDNPIQLYSKQKIVFMSPLHGFMYFKKIIPEFREIIMQMCFDMIDICDEVWVAGTTEGCKAEAMYAYKRDMPVYIIEKDLTPKRIYCNPEEYFNNCKTEYTYDISLLDVE